MSSQICPIGHNQSHRPTTAADNPTASVPTSNRRWRLNSPLTQVILIALVCFCCQGMFRAITGLGGGGLVDPTAANNANTAADAACAIFSFAGGGLYNVLGPRLTLPASCIAFALYPLSYIYYGRTGNEAAIVAGGGALGVGAGYLWVAQGAIMTSYPPASRKGRYISIFWGIFSFGAVVGGLVPLSLNFGRGGGGEKSDQGVNDATYIVFSAIMGTGILLSMAILPGNRVIRKDGTNCTPTNPSKLSHEAMEMLELFTNWKMLLLAPAAWSSNFYYTYQFNNVNAAQFDTRTRGLNNVAYWATQMVGSVAIGQLFDRTFESRRRRGFAGIAVVALVGTGVWGGGLANQMGYSFGRMPSPKLDFVESGADFVGPFVLYVSYGLLDSFFQAMVYWVIGALTDDPEVLSRYVGFYKGVQNVGGLVAWQLDSRKVPMMAQLVLNWGLMTVSYPLLVVLLAFAVKDDDVGDGGEVVKEKLHRDNDFALRHSDIEWI